MCEEVLEDIRAADQREEEAYQTRYGYENNGDHIVQNYNKKPKNW